MSEFDNAKGYEIIENGVSDAKERETYLMMDEMGEDDEAFPNPASDIPPMIPTQDSDDFSESEVDEDVPLSPEEEEMIEQEVLEMPPQIPESADEPENSTEVEMPPPIPEDWGDTTTSLEVEMPPPPPPLDGEDESSLNMPNEDEGNAPSEEEPPPSPPPPPPLDGEDESSLNMPNEDEGNVPSEEEPPPPPTPPPLDGEDESSLNMPNDEKNIVGGETPPPYPEGYVNEFIAPLFDGTNGTLEYNEDGLSSWTVPCPIDAVDMEHNSFTVDSSLVGEWEGGIPPEAHSSEDGDGYVINSWPIEELIDNGNGTVTLMVDVEMPQVENSEEEPPPPPPPPPIGWENTPI